MPSLFRGFPSLMPVLAVSEKNKKQNITSSSPNERAIDYLTKLEKISVACDDTSVIWRRCSAHLGANNSRLLRRSTPIPGFRLSRGNSRSTKRKVRIYLVAWLKEPQRNCHSL